MNIERLQMKELLSESKRKFIKLDCDASGLIVLIRYYLSPYEDVTSLQVDKTSMAMEKLKNTVDEMKLLKVQIKSLEEDLG